jgi:hypothetical protein
METLKGYQECFFFPKEKLSFLIICFIYMVNHRSTNQFSITIISDFYTEKARGEKARGKENF